MSTRIRLVLHRKGDLRLHDNELYHVKLPQNVKNQQQQLEIPWRIVSLFVLNPSDYTPRPVASSSSSSSSSSSAAKHNNDDWLTATEGPHASRALVGALTDLRKNLKALGGNLLIRRGNPLLVVPEIIEQLQANANANTNDNNNNKLELEIVWSEVPGWYERHLSEQLKTTIAATCRATVKIQTTASTYTLYHPDDLPYGEETWSRLARPKEKRSKRHNKNKKNQGNNTKDNDSQSSYDNDNSILGSTNLDAVDCSPSRFAGLPRIMGDFRRAARTHAKVRLCYPPPSKDDILQQHMLGSNHEDVVVIDPRDLPTLQELTEPYRGVSLFGMPPAAIDSIIEAAAQKDNSPDTQHREQHPQSTASTPMVPSGGETAARAAWSDFLKNHAAVADRSLADTSDHNSAHISTALAMGVLSARHIYWSATEEVQKQQQQQNDILETGLPTISDGHTSCSWLVSHMEMRDHFLFTAFAAGKKLYALKGQNPVHGSSKRRQKQTNNKNGNTKEGNDVSTHQDNSSIPPYAWRSPLESSELFEKWATGKTGLPMVDAGMNELTNTGYCSNRVRQNMASVLTKNLHIDWRIGAEWFQFCLEDHCVGANWGNWQYFGGVGGDPKNRIFRTVSQSLRYDAKAVYVQKWLPVETLKALHESKETENGNAIWFRPWDFMENWSTIVDPATQYTWQDRERLEDNGVLAERWVASET